MLLRKHLAFLSLLMCLLAAIAWSQTVSSQALAARSSQLQGRRDPVAEPDWLAVRPTNRIVEPIDETQLFTLAGQRHPLARSKYGRGRAPLDMRMERMVLVLRADPEQDAALQALLRAQQDPESPSYHHWLTPAEFGQRFGVSALDLMRVAKWLVKHGMAIDEVPASRRAIVFSGNVARVEEAFATQIHRYSVNGEMHYANGNDPEIPRALAPVVRGVMALHDFRSVAQYVARPAYTLYGGHFLEPQDWATIYDVLPLYRQGMDGTGTSIAVLGRVDIALIDIRTFRNNAGLAANDPQIITNGADPGFPCCGDELESAMDVEWAGAIAKNATVKFVTTASGTSDGIALSAQYAVNHNVAPVVSLSYGLCEAALGSGGNAFWNNLWMQAAAQGQSVFVSSGDSGAAGCDSGGASKGSQQGVNGLCSSPYSTCVGGTQFKDTSSPSQYWSPTNGAGRSSALSYIPESAWNESGPSSGLWAGGGGESSVYGKPSWQVAPGVPPDGKRDVPDVALHASGADAYVVQIQGSTTFAGGTSASAPSLASLMAMVVENSGAQGNVNNNFYALANQQWSAGGPAVFHDVTSGNNTVPGVTGFSAGTGYDQSTGLGSVDANILLNNWSNPSSMDFAISPSVSRVTLAPGSSATATVALTGQGGFNSAVTLSASGVPSNVTVKFSSTSLTQSAAVTVTVSAAANATVGSNTITLTATGGGLTRTASFAITVAAPSFSLASSVATASLAAGGSTTLTITTTPANGFKSAITLSAIGLPSGVSASFSPTSIASPGSGTSTLTLKAASNVPSGTASLVVKATGGGITQTQAVRLTTTVPALALGTSSANVTVNDGNSSTVTLNTTGSSGFSSAVGLTVGGLPSGVTASFSPASIALPGTGSSTLTVSATARAIGGVYPLTVTAFGGGISKTQAISLTVVGPTITLSLAGTSTILNRGGSIPIVATTAAVNGFNSSVAVGVTNLPKGVTATFSPASIGAPGSGTSTMTLKAASGTSTGTSTVTITATGGGATVTRPLSLTVK